MLGSVSIGAFDGVSLDMLIRQGFRPVPITRTQQVAPDVLLVELSPAEATASFPPGSHLEVAVPLPDGPAIRLYSLVTQVGAGEPTGPGEGSGVLRIAILREAAGRGGSAWLHEHLPTCTSLLVRGPRDTFGYRGDTPTFFVAGGIGITPITVMVAAAAEAGIDWHLLYVGRRLESMAFAEDLARTYGTDRVSIHTTAESGRPDVVAAVREWSAEVGAPVTVCTCGPVPLMRALDIGFADDPAITVISEDFDSDVSPPGSTAPGVVTTGSAARSPVLGSPSGTTSTASFRTADAANSPRTTASAGTDQPFVVELGDGSEVDVPPGCSIIEALGQAGIRTLSSCQKGTCGTCETVILDGEADHRDSVLSPEEHAAQETMMICVSRACGPRITLDL
ncbi:PDR/VanB family oxidoreductase [Brevibacterium sanguinis]|nr:PDR/VanB family oxidoreductase [Brevibacterium sanguinis]